MAAGGFECLILPLVIGILVVHVALVEVKALLAPKLPNTPTSEEGQRSDEEAHLYLLHEQESS